MKLFLEIEHIELASFLSRLVEIIKSNQEAIVQLLDSKGRYSSCKFPENEKTFFQFVTTISPEMYVIGSTGDDFKTIVEDYVVRKPKSEFEILWRLSNLVKDIMTFTSSEVCPQCNSDHLRILADINNEREIV